MIKYLWFFIIVFSFCKNGVQENILPQFATPESTIKYYWSMLGKRNYKEALTCFDGFLENQYNEKDIFPVPDEVDSLQYDSLISLKIKGKKALIYYRVSFYSKRQNSKKIFLSGDRLVLTKSGWKISEVIIPK
ncbi:MAG: hypothetical protein ABIL70_03925 [candidate division WOR-3 bacterium]